MNRQKWIIFAVLLLLLAGAVGTLGRFRGVQKLGAPGVKTAPIEGSTNLKIVLPENVLDYESKEFEQDESVLGALPKDTSFGQRLYYKTNGPWMQVQVVMMGSDRTSIHKPQFCLEGQGFRIDQNASSRETIRIEEPYPYDLPVMRIIANRERMVGGQKVVERCVYVYWFVADGALSGEPSGMERMMWMSWHLLRTGVLQRWAYVSFFSACAPGQEDVIFEHIRQAIAAAVPQFQLTPKPTDAAIAARE